MRLPFDYKDINELYNSIENGDKGFYPFDFGNLWHSGIHVSPKDNNQKEFKNFIPSGEVVLYRISKEYKTINLPSSLSKEDYNKSLYKDSYILSNNKNYYILNSNNKIKNYNISDSFILLKYNMNILANNQKLYFYVLYMNLAPLSDYKKTCYSKDFICDGCLHKVDKPLTIDIIGMPAKFENKYYFEMVLFTENNLLSYKLKKELFGKKLFFYGIKNNIKIFKKDENANKKSIYLPMHSFYQVIQEEVFNNKKSKKIQLRTIRACSCGKKDTPNEHIFKNENTIKVNDICKVQFINKFIFSSGANPLFNYTDIDNSDTYKINYLKKILLPKLHKIIGTSQKVVAKYGPSPAIDIDLKKYGTGYYEFWIDENLFNIFPAKKDIITECTTGNKIINIYEKDPLNSSFKEISLKEESINNLEFEEEFQEKDEQKIYYRFSKEYYITKNDLIFIDAFDLNKWFINKYIESNNNENDLICDKTQILKKSINWQNDIIQSLLLGYALLNIFWTGIYISYKFLKYVFGKTEDASFTKPTRKLLRKILCKHPIEWDKTKFNDLKKIKKDFEFSGTYSDEQAKTLQEQANKTDLWNGGLSLFFKENKLNFAHPLYFLNHFEKAGVLENCLCKQKFTVENLLSISLTKTIAEKYIDSLNETFITFNLNSCLRKAHFLAQVLHESVNFKYTAEINGEKTDYAPYYGRGLIQLTWKENYIKYGNYVNEDVYSTETNRKKLEQPLHAMKSAGWFWTVNSSLNNYADSNDIIQITRIINGGFNGYNDRLNKLIDIKMNIIKNCSNNSFETNYTLEKSSGYNDSLTCFAWGVWHDKDAGKNGCTYDKNEAIKGYKRCIALGSSQKNRYGIKDKPSLYGKPDKNGILLITDAATHRLKQLESK